MVQNLSSPSVSVTPMASGTRREKEDVLMATPAPPSSSRSFGDGDREGTWDGGGEWWMTNVSVLNRGRGIPPSGLPWLASKTRHVG